MLLRDGQVMVSDFSGYSIPISDILQLDQVRSHVHRLHPQ